MALAKLEQPQAPVRLMDRKHVTMIEDDVVERVAAQCGMTGVGLYTMLERRVGKDGTWTTTVGALAQAFQVSERHIRDTCKTLEEAGFIHRETLLGPNGAKYGIRFTLPFHMRTYAPEPTPEVRPEPSGEPTPEPSREPVIRVSSSSNHKVITSNGDSPPTPSEPPKEKSKRKHRMPEDFGLTPERLAYALERGMTEPEAADLLEDMRLWSHGKGGMYEEWDLAWKSWVRKHARERPRAAKAPPTPIRTDQAATNLDKILAIARRPS